MPRVERGCSEPRVRKSYARGGRLVETREAPPSPVTGICSYSFDAAARKEKKSTTRFPN